jgi:hypothetical protein
MFLRNQRVALKKNKASELSQAPTPSNLNYENLVFSETKLYCNYKYILDIYQVISEM